MKMKIKFLPTQIVIQQATNTRRKNCIENQKKKIEKEDMVGYTYTVLKTDPPAYFYQHKQKLPICHTGSILAFLHIFNV